MKGRCTRHLTAHMRQHARGMTINKSSVFIAVTCGAGHVFSCSLGLCCPMYRKGKQILACLRVFPGGLNCNDRALRTTEHRYEMPSAGAFRHGKWDWRLFSLQWEWGLYSPHKTAASGQAMGKATTEWVHDEQGPYLKDANHLFGYKRAKMRCF